MDRTFSATILGIIPILLIHGYAEDAHVWDNWLKWFKADHLTAKAITFSEDDKCGTVKEHAEELTNYTKVNIVAHSAGGLVARLLHATNLVMIATPNRGTTAALMDLTSCAGSGSAGLEDLKPNSDVTQTPDKPHTHYYAVAGNLSDPCYFVLLRYTCYLEENDGLVTVSSALSNYSSLGVFPYNHTSLLKHKDVYEKVLPILRAYQ